MGLLESLGNRPPVAAPSTPPPPAEAPAPPSTPQPPPPIPASPQHLSDDIVLQLLASAAMRAERETGTRQAASMRQLVDVTHGQLIDVMRALQELQRAADKS